MVNEQKRDFKELMIATMALYQQEISVDMLRMWWASLVNYEFNDVRDAISRHIQDKAAGKFAPRPANIIEQLDAMKPDGRPGADEAWAMIPRDEHASVVMTDEMAEAMQFATPLLNEGDQVAARMAFKQAYERIVGEKKRAGIPAKWFPSLGHDPQGRELALKQAADRGLLPRAQVDALLPAPAAPVVAEMAGLMIANKAALTDEQKAESARRMQDIKTRFFGTSKDMHKSITEAAA